VYRDVQQSINPDLLRRFRHPGIEFAYPIWLLSIGGSGESLPSGAQEAGRKVIF
jgi:hypothetical protein